MASGVFGTPITVETVRATGLHPEPITRRNCADYALRMINAGGKDAEALRFVDNLKAEYGNGISAKCLIYNATGTTLTHVTDHDWHGQIYDTPYPATIQNGQWGGFLHVHPTGALVGAAGAVVYRSLRPDDNQTCDWFASWSMPYTGGSNRVYTEIREAGHFPSFWDYIYSERLENGGRSSEDNNYGYWSTTMIGATTTSVFRAEFKIAAP